jgi:DNA adenine methylase
MKYMGSKRKYAKYILPIILRSRRRNLQWYVEPFVGGFNVVDKVDGKRLVSDSNRYLIKLFVSIVYDGWSPPEFVSYDFYEKVRNDKDNYPDELVGYIGFNSFGGKWFAGYRRDGENIRDYWGEHYRNIMSQVSRLKGVVIKNDSYIDLSIPDNSVIYCDPPYKDTVSYVDKFDHGLFWEWVREKRSEGHLVFVSEYSAPNDFKCIWRRSVVNSLDLDTGSKTGEEKLFVHVDSGEHYIDCFKMEQIDLF